MATTERLPSGKYRGIVRINGQKKFTKAVATKAGAMADAVAMENSRNQGGLVTKMPEGTIGRYIQLYREELEERSRWGTTKENHLNVLARDLGDIEAAKLTKQMIFDYGKRLSRERRADGVTPRRNGETILGRISYLGEVFKAASDLWDVHPIVSATIQAGLSALKRRDICYINEGRDRQTTAPEVERIKDAAFASCGPAATVPLADMIHILEVLPLRTGELLKIKREDFVPEERMVWLRARKHPNPRIKQRNDEKIPLMKIKGRDTWELIYGRLQDGMDAPFDYLGNSVAHAWRRAAKRAGAEDLHMHDLRAHAITEMMMAGVKLTSIMRISGHKNYKVMLGRYARINPQAVADEIELLMNDQEKAEIQADIKAKGAKLRLVA
jgi:integrase